MIGDATAAHYHEYIQNERVQQVVPSGLQKIRGDERG